MFLRVLCGFYLALALALWPLFPQCPLWSILVVVRPGCTTNLGFFVLSRKFSSRFEFGLSVLISLICVISGEVLVFQRAQRIQRQKFLIVAQPGCG